MSNLRARLLERAGHAREDDDPVVVDQMFVRPELHVFLEEPDDAFENLRVHAIDVEVARALFIDRTVLRTHAPNVEETARAGARELDRGNDLRKAGRGIDLGLDQCVGDERRDGYRYFLEIFFAVLRCNHDLFEPATLLCVSVARAIASCASKDMITANKNDAPRRPATTPKPCATFLAITAPLFYIPSFLSKVNSN